MHHTSSSRALRLVPFLCGVLLYGAACASDDGAQKKDAPAVGKHRFTPSDYNLDFLEADKTAERLSPMVVDKIRAVLDHLEHKLPSLLAAMPPPAPQMIQIAVGKGRPILEHKLEAKLTALIAEHRAKVDPVVQRYNVFEDPALSYDLIEKSSDETRATIDRVNRALKDAYRTARAIRVARLLLAVGHKDAAALKAAQANAAADPSEAAAALAGVGVGALSITELSIEAIDDAHQLLPELKQLSEDLTNQIGANPLQAIYLGGALSAVGGAIAELSSVPKDAAALLSEASDLLTLFE